MNTLRYRVLRRAALAAAALLAATAVPAAASVRPIPRYVPAYIALRLASKPDNVITATVPDSADQYSITLEPWTNTTDQLWKLKGGYGDDEYELVNAHTGLCMGNLGPDNSGYDKVVQLECDTDYSLRLQFRIQGNGFQIFHAYEREDDCLNVMGGPIVGNSLIFYPCFAHGADNDVWLPTYTGWT